MKIMIIKRINNDWRFIKVGKFLICRSRSSGNERGLFHNLDDLWRKKTILNFLLTFGIEEKMPAI